jgi:hypothetical protein
MDDPEDVVAPDTSVFEAMVDERGDLPGRVVLALELSHSKAPQHLQGSKSTCLNVSIVSLWPSSKHKR